MIALLEDKRNGLITLLALLTGIAIFHAGGRFALWMATGVCITALLDFLVNKLIFSKTIIPKSAIISGFIVVGILDHYQPWYILLIFSALPVVSKHLIKFPRRGGVPPSPSGRPAGKGRHIFNPANFALFFASCFRIPLTWTIESNIYIIIAAGIYIIYSLKKLPHVIGFLTFFTALFALQGINPISLISWFFIFVMLIEPKTSGYGNVRGAVFGAIAGIASFLISNFLPQIDLFVGALFLANLLCLPVIASPEGARA